MADSSSTTIKFGGAFESPWIVATGSAEDQRLHLIEAFDLDRGQTQDLSLYEVALECSAQAQAGFLAAQKLGGRVVASGGRSSSRSKPQAAETPSVATTPPAPEPAAAEASQDPNAELLAELAAAATKQELRLIWAKNQEAFQDATVGAAFEARAKEIA